MTYPSPDTFEDGKRRTIVSVLSYLLAAAVLLGLLYFVYTQLTGIRGITVEAPSPQIVAMMPDLPPPPPPPPPPDKIPPEPTEKAQPAPSTQAPKSAQPQAAAMTVAAAPQAGSDSFGLQAGSGGGIGAPGGTGTCLGTSCGGAPAGGNGMSETIYRRYLSAALQDRVQADDALARLVFSADLALTVTPGGVVTGVRLIRASGRNDRAVTQKLSSILEQVRGLDPPPAAMRFPQKITVRGKRSL